MTPVKLIGAVENITMQVNCMHAFWKHATVYNFLPSDIPC